MNVANWAPIVIAAIAAFGAWAAQRTAAKAAKINVVTSGRVDMEKEAYDRARAFDTETIRRQDAEIEELRASHSVCTRTIKDLEAEVTALRLRIARLEKGLTQSIEEMLHERLNEPDETDSE